MLPRLNFPAYDFKVSRDGGDIRIWDALRRAWLPLTPEEWVRQHLVRYLIEECGAPPALVVQELVIPLGGAPQRADVVVHGRDGRPVLLAECKAPGVAIDKEAVAREVFSQAVRYNSVVGARYIVITNGLLHFVRELLPDGSYRALSGFPKLDV